MEQAYNPKLFQGDVRLGAAHLSTAWRGLERIIKPIIDDFKIENRNALEFGVEHGFSTSAFANFFDTVTGVDTFEGDIHCGIRESFFEATKENLKDFPNVTLVKQSYQDYIANPENDKQYGLIHIDIVHTYEDTYACGLWALSHAEVVVFHDTESFPEVKRALLALSELTGKNFYNFKQHHGLGILTMQSL